MFATVSPAPLLPLMIGPLGMQEMLIILAVALIVFGPRKLPQIGKTLGKSLAEFRRTSTELRSTLEREVQMEEFRAARTEISDMKKDVSDLGRGLDPDAGSGPRGEEASAAGKRGGSDADESSGTAAGEPDDARTGPAASVPESGGGEETSGTSAPPAGGGAPNPASREDTGN